MSMEYEQGSIIPPDVVELTLRIGLVDSTSHGQWQFTVTEAPTDTLLAMSSKHHFHSGDWAAELEEIGYLLRTTLEAHISPF